MAEGYVFPLAGGRITSYFGLRGAPAAGASADHKGIDIAAAAGSSVRAALDGFILSSGFNQARGNYIVVQHNTGERTIYQHLQNALLKAGEKVTAGQPIGTVGSSGISTGPHLHFEVLGADWKNIDPLKWEGEGMIDKIENALPAIDTSGLMELVKKYWYFIAGGLVILAVIRK